MAKRVSEEDKYLTWFHGVVDRGELGPSPGGAARDLGCTRQMVHFLIKQGVLKANFYKSAWFMPARVCFVSRASIEAARERKRSTGKWFSGDEGGAE